MATILNPGDKVRDLTIEQELNIGSMAVSYAARNDRGERFFLKQYKSPSVRVPWYRPFIAYQKELRRRIETTPCKDFSYRFLDSFEFERCFYQVFEFLDRSDSLQQVLEQCRTRPHLVNWEQRQLMARVLMSGIRTMHECNIVHADLKPDNIMLIRDDSIRMKYRLRIIDMDFSLFTDRQAPWHGYEGYLGTPGYTSPEHLAGMVPQPASDVFTCALMLYELLADGHPYRSLAEDPLKVYQEHRVDPPRLQETMPPPACNDEVKGCLHRCLQPDPRLRPTADTVFRALTGKSTPVEGGDRPSEKRIEMAEEKDKRPVGRLVLRGDSGEELNFGARTAVGRVLCARFGEDSLYCSERQFILDRDDSGWWIESVEGTTNDTLVNGATLTARRRLEAGDRISVGKPGGRTVHLPLTVHF